jgi:beta-lactamase superfamily II metal-dependent hydrolase
MATIHFLNVLEGDCNIIKHNSGRITVMDVSNAYNDEDTDEEKAVKSSKEREEMRNRTHVPSNKTNYNQKKEPDNPIDYLKTKLKVSSIFRFIISHPDMDHLDGIKDLYEEFEVVNTWDTDNDKDIDLNNFFGGYNKEDWKFYKNLRAGKNTDTKRLTYFSKQSNQYYNEDDITILCPTAELVKNGNDTEDYNDASYAILFTPPKKDGGKWKILLAGDTHDDSWDYILKNHKSEVSNIDVLFAPHHGRDSDRNYDFLDTLKPKVTLFGNASSKHLAYNKYPKIRITNNQAGFVILDTTEEHLKVYVKNFEFAKDFRAERGWDAPQFNSTHQAYFLFMYNA